MIFTGLTITFLKQFGIGLWLTSPMLFSLAVVIALLGLFVGKKESWSRSNSIYWAFITATTVGYGDFRPVKTVSKAIAVPIALLGLLMTGILIAIGVHAATIALDAHDAAVRLR